MMDSHKWVLLGACMATLSGCGGSDDHQSTVETKVAPVSHISAEYSQENIIKQGISLPQRVFIRPRCLLKVIFRR